MSEHVSVETGRALAAAGLAHEWAVGDWCWTKHDGTEGLSLVKAVVSPTRDNPNICLWLSTPWWGEGRPAHQDVWSLCQAARDCLWLPTAADLLQELAQRKAPYTVRCISLPDNKWTWMLTVRDWITGNGPDLAEAAAAALLAVLQEEVQR